MDIYMQWILIAVATCTAILSVGTVIALYYFGYMVIANSLKDSKDAKKQV